MEVPEEISAHSVFTYADEITVELRGRTADGEFAVLTYQFEPAADDETRVRPRGSTSGVPEETLREILDDAGYTLTEPHVASSS